MTWDHTLYKSPAHCDDDVSTILYSLSALTSKLLSSRTGRKLQYGTFPTIAVDPVVLKESDEMSNNAHR
jgi:hypothetical protein